MLADLTAGGFLGESSNSAIPDSDIKSFSTPMRDKELGDFARRFLIKRLKKAKLKLYLIRDTSD